MKTIRLLILMGIIATATFLSLDIWGSYLWKEYNPMTMFISYLTADGAPNLKITRFLYYLYNICLILFCIGFSLITFRYCHKLIKIGGLLLLTAVFISFFGNGSFPLTMNYIFEKQNLIHICFTIIMFTITALMLYFLAVGYLKEEKEIRIGYISLVAAIMFSLFNIIHFYVILNDINASGLVQRLSSYTFFIYISILSLSYFRKLKIKL